MKTEILLALVDNVKGIAKPLAVLSILGLIVSIIGKTITAAEEKRLQAKVAKDGERSYSADHLLEASGWLSIWSFWCKYLLRVLLLTLPISLTPSTRDLWKIRIDLIKLELSSPENIKQGAEAINRIAEKLECKYLGCEKEEGKK